MMQTSISIIIPTHNRKDSLECLLRQLREQTYPLDLMEVIVVADGCTDSTMQMLENFRAPYKFNFTQQNGYGAGTARNNGASLASGQLLLFLDDDILPSKGLLEAHVLAHKDQNTVVIGRLELATINKPAFFFILYRFWWENKYFAMRSAGYRYSYEDLLSGNFSVSASLFKSINGFDNTFRCREDYELGARLIKHGANFVFANDAWGYHNDEVNNLCRSFHRKRQEGKADVQMGFLHTDLIGHLKLTSLGHHRRYVQQLLIFSVFKGKLLSQVFFESIRKILPFIEAMKMRRTYRKIIIILNEYWYFRGVADELKSFNALNDFIRTGNAAGQNTENYIELDLKNGLSHAEEQIKSYRPSGIYLRFGPCVLGKISHKPAFEKLRAEHFRFILEREFSIPLLKLITRDKNNLTEKITTIEEI